MNSEGEPDNVGWNAGDFFTPSSSEGFSVLRKGQLSVEAYSSSLILQVFCFASINWARPNLPNKQPIIENKDTHGSKQLFSFQFLSGLI